MPNRPKNIPSCGLIREIIASQIYVLPPVEEATSVSIKDRFKVVFFEMKTSNILQ